jgi:hypothetical protein
MATVVFTDKGIIPNAAGKRFVDGKTYSATTKAAVGNQWSPPPDPFKAYADEKRRQEAIARSEAAARANIPNFLNPNSIPLRGPEMGDVPLVPAPETKVDLFNPSAIDGPENNSQSINLVPAPQTNADLLSPSAIKGREREGYVQVPAKDSFGNVIKYDYVKIEDNIQEMRGDTSSLYSSSDFRTTGKVVDGSKDAITYDDLISSLNLPELPNEFMAEMDRVKTQLYGEKKPQLMPNGDIEYFYDSDFQRFHGITPDMQAAGFLAGAVLDPPGPNASEEEKAAYYEDSKRGLYAVPLYKTGYEYSTLGMMTMSEKAALQKKMKKAGYYTDKETLWPGIFQQNDLIHYQAALGEANVAGLEVDDLFKLRARSRQKAIAEARNAGGGSGTPTRTVDISFNTTTMANGRTLLTKVLQDALGRAPSDEELSQFMSMLNNAESKSPTKTITQYVNGGGTRTSTSRTTPSEVDPTLLAEEFAAGIDGGVPMTAKKETDYLMGYLNSLGGVR